MYTLHTHSHAHSRPVALTNEMSTEKLTLTKLSSRYAARTMPPRSLSLPRRLLCELITKFLCIIIIS